MEKTGFQNIKMRGIYWLAKRLPDCREMTPVIGESLDRMLSLREKIVMKLHLLTCKACRNYLSNLQFMKEAFQKKEKLEIEENPVGSLNAEARERIKNALKKSA